MTGRTDVGEFGKTTFPFYDKKTCVRDPRGLNSVDRKSIFVPLFRENARQNPFFFLFKYQFSTCVTDHDQNGRHLMFYGITIHEFT